MQTNGSQKGEISLLLGIFHTVTTFSPIILYLGPINYCIIMSVKFRTSVQDLIYFIDFDFLEAMIIYTRKKKQEKRGL